MFLIQLCGVSLNLSLPIFVNIYIYICKVVPQDSSTWRCFPLFVEAFLIYLLYYIIRYLLYYIKFIFYFIGYKTFQEETFSSKCVIIMKNIKTVLYVICLKTKRWAHISEWYHVTLHKKYIRIDIKIGLSQILCQ